MNHTIHNSSQNVRSIRFLKLSHPTNSEHYLHLWFLLEKQEYNNLIAFSSAIYNSHGKYVDPQVILVFSRILLRYKLLLY